ncbi:MAG: dihydropteroate synthase [Candidatus Staskawiczbacteria bacterium]|nr:dihydropteroate synthase [Candidatus Staskawiczbacteria bacterium]
MKTKVMGILNVTPDSFSDGGLYLDAKKALERAQEMIKEGVDIIDIGGESTRPGSEPVSEDEELKRVLPVVKLIREKLGQDILISIDTYKSKVAEECLKAGANMINSLGGFTFDAGLADVIVKYHCPVILYHIKGQPKTMQASEVEYGNVVSEIKEFFNAQIEIGAKKGMHTHDFILDPGIGFGKNVEHNLEIIRKFEEFQTFSMPLAVGVSRKSHLGAILKEELGLKEAPVPQERVEAGLAEVGMVVLKGASIIRTHDVLATKKFLAVLDRLNYL